MRLWRVPAVKAPHVAGVAPVDGAPVDWSGGRLTVRELLDELGLGHLFHDDAVRAALVELAQRRRTEGK